MSTKGVKYMKRDTKKGTEDKVMVMHQMMLDAEESISILQNAFIYHNAKLLQECKRKVEDMKKEGSQLTPDAIKIFAHNHDLKPYCSIPAHIVRIVESIEKLAGHINKKIDENILFSDKAVRETTFLLQRLIEILAPAADIVLARNAFLTMYIQESQTGVGKMAMEYATLHEERLINGVCNSAASSMYIGMLDEIKNIAWHSKEIAVKLAGK